MFQSSRTSLRNLYLGDGTVLTMQTYARQSNALGERRTCPLGSSPQSQVRCAAALVPAADYASIPATPRDSAHPPKSSANANVWSASGGANLWHLPGLAGLPHARGLPAASRAYRSKYGVFCRLFSSQ